MLVKVTHGMIEDGKSRRGGWSEDQLLWLGVTYPPKKGWKAGLVGQYLPQAWIDAFLRLKDRHLSRGRIAKQGRR